jgi:hypothetical protein
VHAAVAKGAGAARKATLRPGLDGAGHHLGEVGPGRSCSLQSAYGDMIGELTDLLAAMKQPPAREATAEAYAKGGTDLNATRSHRRRSGSWARERA